MQWSKEVPRQEGYYWRYQDGQMDCGKLEHGYDEFMAFNCGVETLFFSYELDMRWSSVLWYGPIPPPAPPQEQANEQV